MRIALAVGLSTLSIALVLLMLPPQEPPVQRSVLLLDPILLIMILIWSIYISQLEFSTWRAKL